MPKSSFLFQAILALTLIYVALVTLALAEEAAPPTADPANAQEPTDSSTEGTKPADDPTPEPIPDDATLRKMKVRELKAILARKGPDAECLACTSKQEYVDRIHETADWPDVKQEEKPDDEDTPSLEELAAMFNKGRDSEEMARLRKNLEEAGIDASNIFSTGGDFDADAFAKQFSSWEKKQGAGAGADVPPPSDDVKAEL